jgi:predicted lipoprotein with Yx(FWY)xxD motif
LRTTGELWDAPHEVRRAIALVLLVGGLATSIASAQSRATATVNVARTRLGPILVDARGRTLYLYTADVNGIISCVTGQYGCPSTWPPYLTTGAPKAGAGVNASLLGSVKRKQPAGTQVTYAGHPLYRYVGDQKPGDLHGQALYSSWYVVAPTGKPIKKH